MITRIFSLVVIGLLLLCGTATKAAAQGGVTLQPLAPYCSLSSMAAATSLTSCSGGIPLGAIYAVVCSYTQGVVWRDDGPDPTGTPGSGGQGIAAGQCIPYNGRMNQIKFIQQTGGAVLGVTFYK